MTSINNIFLNPFKPKYKANSGETELGLFYTNDMHGDVNRLSKFKTAHDKFLSANKDTQNLTLAAGDCLFGSNKQRNSLMVKLFNLMGLDALALGNHEFAGGSKKLSDSLENTEFKTVSANLEIDKDNPLQKSIKNKKLVKSAVFMKGGHKFAVIGASPFDSYINSTDKSVNVKNLDNTIKEINAETKKLEEQGVNKIILLSHLGYGEQGDLAVARQTQGVDIIVGGHSHTVIDGVNTTSPRDKKDVHKLNLLMSKRNEPVLITQAGGMNEYAGYLNVVFDDKGVLKTNKIENKLVDLNQFEDSSIANELMDEELGEKVKLADVKGEYSPKNSFSERNLANPLANAFADAILARGKKYGADISLFNGATIRGGAKGQITNYDVKFAMLPFNSEIKVVEISEKDLVQMLKNTVGSTMTTKDEPALLRASGMKYSVRNDKEYFLNGGTEPIQKVKIGKRDIDVKNPDENIKVKVALNSYLFSMPETKDVLAKYKDFAVSIGHEQEIFMEYLKEHETLDFTKTEERVKQTVSYGSRIEFDSAREEILKHLNK